MFGFDRITFDQNIMVGQACIRGMRVPVSLMSEFGGEWQNRGRDY